VGRSGEKVFSILKGRRRSDEKLEMDKKEGLLFRDREGQVSGVRSRAGFA
jgi:hypothetical protein